jgi:hypothetical protein
MMSRRLGLALIAAVLASACQSTVRNGVTIAMDELETVPSVVAPTDPVAAGEVTDAGPTDGPSAAPSAAPSGSSSGGGLAPSIPGATPGSQGATTTPPTGDTEPGGDGETAPPPQVAEPEGPDGDRFAQLEMGPGVTQDTITVGVHVTTELQAAFSAVGANSSGGDERQISQAIIDWMNDNGGIAGRQIVPVYHETNPASGTWASQAQAACDTFTDDNQVFAVSSSTVGGDDSMLACLAAKNTPLIENNLWVFDRPYYEARRGILYQPARMMADRWVRAYVDGLERSGYLADGKEGLGLLRFDHPVFDRLSNGVFRPRLAALGYELRDEVVISSPKGLSDFGAMANQLNSAVLRMRSRGVTHVMMLENAGIMPFFWFDQAESQGYRPRYGLSSSDIPQTQQNNADPEQLRDSVVVGWQPGSDLERADIPADNPQHALCEQVMEQAGIVPTGFYTQPRCDSFFFLKAALERAPALTSAGLLAGVESLGGQYRSSASVQGLSRFGPGRYDGPNAVRLLAFDMSCACYRVASDATALS